MGLLSSPNRPPATNAAVAIIEAFRGGAVMHPINPIAPEAVFEFDMSAFAAPIRIDYATLSESPNATFHSLLDFVFRESQISVRECASESGKLVLQFRNPLQFRPWELLLYSDHNQQQEYLFAAFMFEAAQCLQHLTDVLALEEAQLSVSDSSWIAALPFSFPNPKPTWVKLLSSWKAVRDQQAGTERRSATRFLLP